MDLNCIRAAVAKQVCHLGVVAFLQNELHRIVGPSDCGENDKGDHAERQNSSAHDRFLLQLQTPIFPSVVPQLSHSTGLRICTL
jgi:hypothetical protein